MSDYNFDQLSSIDFEQLANDLLSAELGISFESFKEGKDQGIDLRHIGKHAKIIVQCKRYKKDAYSTLASSVKKEKAKMDKAKPSKYILFTSTALSAKNKDDIIKNLSPHCLSPADIYGHSEINALIRRFPEIERVHYKLWMPSTTILNKIISADIDNLSILTLNQVRQKILQYHRPPYFSEAEEILKSFGHILIAGPAGSGKTALTQLLAVQYLADGYEVISISADIKSSLQRVSETKKQLFIYDDFLGQTSFEEKLEKNEDNLIVKLIQRCAACSNTKFILSTREYILKAAYNTYEKLYQSKDITQSITLNPAKLSIQEKAKITHSMLHYSEIDLSRKIALVLAGCHKKLINSDNFNPRIVDMSFNHGYWKNATADEHIDIIQKNISSPSVLWDHIYNNQLSDQQKSTIDVIGSFGRKVSIEHFERACASYYSFLQCNHIANPGAFSFKKTMKILVGDFLITSYDTRDGILVSAINPSLKDFVSEQISSDGSKKNLFLSSVYFEQIKTLVTEKFNRLNSFGLGLKSKLIEQGKVLVGSSCELRRSQVIPGQIITLLSWLHQLEMSTDLEIEERIEQNLLSVQRVNLVEIQQLCGLLKVIKCSDEFNLSVLATLQKHFAREFDPQLMDEDDLDDWEVVSEISNDYPEIIDEFFLAELPDIFEDFCEANSAAFCDETLDEDELNEFRDKIDAIASNLGCVGSLTYEIEARIEELLEEEETRSEALSAVQTKINSAPEGKIVKSSHDELIDQVFFDFTGAL
jgi:hypothetical protein